MNEEKKIFYGWWIVLVCFFSLFIAYGARFYSFGVFFKPMSKELGWTRTMTASAFGLSTILYGLAAPLVGKILDKYGAKYLISGGAFLGGIGFMLCYFTADITQFYIFYTVIMTLGISATGLVSTNGAVAKWFTKKRATAMGILSAGAGLGAFVLVPIAERLVSKYGWRLSFVFMGLIVWIALIPISLLLLKNTPQEMGLLPDGEKEISPANKPAGENLPAKPKAPTWTLKQAMATPAFWLISANFFLFLITYMFIIIHLVPFGTDIGHSRTVAAFAISLLTVVSIPAKLCGGYIGDRIDLKKLLMGAFLLQFFSMILFLNILGVKSVSSLYAFVVIFGFAYGIILPLTPALVAKLYGAPSMGVIWGGIILIGTFGGGLGPILAGKIYDVTQSYSLAFLSGAVGLLVGAATLIFVKQPKQKVIGA